MQKKNTIRNTFTLITISMLFITPYLLARFFYFHNALTLNQLKNHGRLISPPLDMSKLNLSDNQGLSFNQKSLRGKWVLLYVNPATCGNACQKNLYYMHQTKAALGKDSHRVKLVVLTFNRHHSNDTLRVLLKEKYNKIKQLVVDKHAFWDFLNTKNSTTGNLSQSYLYFVDPHGNIMMSYPAQAKPTAQLKDLKHLLRVSQIG